MNDILTMVDLADIFCDHEFNCRGQIAPFDVIPLAQNIQQNGLLQPITIQPYGKKPPFKYRIVVGHRRYMAVKTNGSKEIKAIIKDDLTEDQAIVLNIIENVARQDLNILQEARAIYRYKLAGLTIKTVADKLQMSAGWVQTRFALLEMPPEIQNEAAAGILTGEQIKLMANMSRDDMFETTRQIKDAKLKGEKYQIPRKKTKVKNPKQKKIRLPTEIEEMQDLIIDGIGNNIATRALGWAAGYVSDLEFLQFIKIYADKEGIAWSIPTEYVANS